MYINIISLTLLFQEPLQVFCKIHSFAGITAMHTHDQFSNSAIVSSAGRDGCHRYWKICKQSETVFQVRCEILPTKWPFIITNSSAYGLLICGFKEVRLVKL